METVLDVLNVIRWSGLMAVVAYGGLLADWYIRHERMQP
jgi:hypothetical protein